LLQRHGQHGIDLTAGLRRGPGYQEIRALRHARHDPQLGIGQAPLQVRQEFIDMSAQLLERRGVQIPMAGHADDEG